MSFTRELLLRLARNLTPPAAFAMLVLWAVAQWGDHWPREWHLFLRAVVLLPLLLYGLREIVRALRAARPSGPQARHHGPGDIVQVRKGIGKAEEATYIEEQHIHHHAPRPSPVKPSPAGLPPLRSDIYVPRGIEDQVLQHLAAARAVAIVGVTGPGGVGKTHAAWHLARTLQQQGRIAAVYWISCADRDMPTILQDYAAQCGIDTRDLTPTQVLSEIRGYLQAQCRQQPVLVVLDDVRAPHVPWLQAALPPAPCWALVTSRRRDLPLPHTVGLDVMTEAQARALLTQILGADALQAEPDAVAELLRLTHRHPLALDVAARRIRLWRAHGQTRPITLFVADLRAHGLDALQHDQDVRAVLQRSYHMLDEPELQRSFRWLGVFAVTGFTVAEAAGLWGVEEGQAQARLRHLVNLSLARPAPPRPDRPDLPLLPRYTLHHLLHELAQDELRAAGETEAAHRALAEYYLRAFSEHYLSNPLQAPYLVHAFDHLERLAAWARERGEAALLARLATTPHNWLANVYHRWDAWRQWLEAALALGIDDPALQANTLKAMGDVLRYQDDLDGAMDHYRRALDLFVQVHSRLGQANVLAGLSRLALLQGDDALAADLMAQAATLRQAIQDRYGTATDHFNFGLALRQLGRAAEARPHLRRAAEIYAEIGLEHFAAQARALADEAADE